MSSVDSNSSKAKKERNFSPGSKRTARPPPQTGRYSWQFESIAEPTGSQVDTPSPSAPANTTPQETPPARRRPLITLKCRLKSPSRTKRQVRLIRRRSLIPVTPAQTSSEAKSEPKAESKEPPQDKSAPAKDSAGDKDAPKAPPLEAPIADPEAQPNR